MKLEISGVDEKGRGVGGDLFTPFAYPGDTIEAELVNKRKKTGRLISIITPSKHRQDAPCKHFGECGGCFWQGLKCEAQLKFKEEKIRDLFGIVNPIIASPNQYFYRNRMDFAFGPDFSIGLKSGKSKVINVEKCHLMSEKSNLIIDHLRRFVSYKKLEYHWTGIMRHVVIREGKNIDNTVINVITSDRGKFPLEELWEKLGTIIDGASWSINTSPADRSVGDLQKTFGNDYLLETLNGLKFKIPLQSFFQTNTHQAENLLNIIKTLIEDENEILDLYSGTGSIGLFLADKNRKVIGIEENEAAVELSKSNAELNGISNYSAYAGKVEDMIYKNISGSETIILDPPRPGVNKKVLKIIGDKKPKKVVYVSCNPYTQKHDVEILKEFGYEINYCQPLDMFPHTPHIENVILLRLP
ncbi:MAG: hypothetical protein FD145_468 [Candidatus Saganbacteria bacterium]|uniref:23S rRNA (Uracil(1939)-C(5))-methyltransferase RlmD n=1 Tax=Candidatus Saganbacteria bacterium TaxID=2575572 RepID=A0A833L1T0_UNCSA|nr:MAG: hypothetical protein FD145_468 [Candidatus Saganbacteria bacterium]